MEVNQEKFMTNQDVSHASDPFARISIESSSDELNIRWDWLDGISWQDGVFLGSFLVIFLLMLFIPLRRLYQAYLGIIVGFFLFIFLNLSLGSLSEVTENSTKIHVWLADHKKMMSVWSIFLIPFLGIIMAINHHITLQIPESKWGYFLFKLLLCLLFFPFLCTLFYAILGNEFFFTLSGDTITILKKIPVFVLFEKVAANSVFFQTLFAYSTLVNLSVMLFIVYKMTFWGIFEYIGGKIFAGIKKIGDKIPTPEQKSDDKKD